MGGGGCSVPPTLAPGGEHSIQWRRFNGDVSQATIQWRRLIGDFSKATFRWRHFNGDVSIATFQWRRVCWMGGNLKVMLSTEAMSASPIELATRAGGSWRGRFRSIQRHPTSGCMPCLTARHVKRRLRLRLSAWPRRRSAEITRTLQPPPPRHRLQDIASRHHQAVALLGLRSPSRGPRTCARAV